MASATHFWPSRTTPSPGKPRITASTRASPGPVAINAGTVTATSASSSSGVATRRRISNGTPIATIVSRAITDSIANTLVRDAGTASAFQMPPRPARLPRVPRPGSARAANAATPASATPA